MSFIFGHYSPEFNVSFYYVRKETASSTSAVADLKEIEREKINAQLKRAKDIVKEKSAEEMRKWAQEKTYYQRTKEFSEMNNLFLMCWFLAVVAVLILKN